MSQGDGPLAPKTSRREQAKGERRARVVDAACELLREVGVEALSVRAVSARAGVSLSTIYNLFASKDAILTSVYDQDLVKFEALVDAAGSGDALDRIFDAIDIAAGLYRADPSFYRAIMWRRSDEPADPDLDARLREPRTRFWPAMAARAADEGLLRPGTDPAVLGVLMMQSLGGVISDWIGDRISVERLPTEAKLAFAVILSAFATGETALRLRKLIQAYHRQLSLEHRRAAGLDDALSARRPAARL
jgi:AcrR family transcriptional regulator